jgi:YjbE family integral membrane protein
VLRRDLRNEAVSGVFYIPGPASKKEWAVSFLPNLELWARLLSIMLIDLTLAADNALIIALVVRGLPANVQVLGAVWGTIGAIVLRIAFTVAAALLLHLPGVQILAAALLIWIAFRLVQPRWERRQHSREPATTLLEAIWIIALADAAMSLDNVLAIAAAAAGNLPLMAIGVVLSLPLVMWGSQVLAAMMNRYSWIVPVAAGVLGYVAGQMALRDALMEKWREHHGCRRVYAPARACGLHDVCRMVAGLPSGKPADV